MLGKTSSFKSIEFLIIYEKVSRWEHIFVSRETNLVKNTFLLSLGRFLPKAVQIITLPIITDCLTKAEYGTHDLISTLVMLLMPIATLQIQSAAFRFLIDCREDDKQKTEIISNILAVVFPVSFVVSLGLVIFYPGFNLIFRIVLAVYFFLESLESTLAQIARGVGNNKAYSIGAIALAWINGLGIVLALKMMNKGLMGLIVSIAFSYLIAFIYFCITLKIWRYFKISAINKSKTKELIAYSWPMIPNNLSNWVLKLSDRLVITAYLGIGATAVYGVANKIPNVLAMSQSVIVNAWQENASMAVKDSDSSEYYSRVFDTVFSLMIGFTALLIGFTPVMFKLLIRGNYEDSYIQMPLLILAMFFYCMSGFHGGIYVAHKKTKSVGVTTMTAAAINLAIDFLLVNHIGITAGSISTLVAYIVLYVYRTLDSRKFQPIKYDFKKQGLLFALVTAMLVMCFIRNFYLNCVNIVIGTIVFCILNKKMMISVVKRIKRVFKKTTA